ncbi:siderophore-iron reductase FhuF [Archangium lipolyticum]|uniref:siderophore-iron reductase FhuF n=1 Tax=Archangium lipolyticum TaxID=2970465 RepID=UPI00214A5ADB|nr:siderophore-iron reductase FhuF [Archangium lipolyticum]
MTLAAMDRILPLLAPYESRLLLGEHLHGRNVVRASVYLEDEHLLAAVRRLMETLQTGELRAAASLWHKHYNAALLSGFLAAMTLAGVGLDGSISNVSMTLSEEGLPRAAVLHSLAGIVVHPPRLKLDISAPRVGLDVLHGRVLSSLFANHLAPIVEQVHRVTGLPKRILWGNAGNLCADVYDGLRARPEVAAAVEEDRRILLEQPDSPLMPGPNPLHQSVRYEDLSGFGRASVVRVRKTCCQRYKLPGLLHCYTCPILKGHERVALLRKLGLPEHT